MPLRILCGLLIDFSNVSTVAGIIDGTWMFETEIQALAQELSSVGETGPQAAYGRVC